MRQIPDHQEVWSDPRTDQSVIVEILELADVADDKSAMYHFRELAGENASGSTTIVTPPQSFPAEAVPALAACSKGKNVISSFVVGRQLISKLRDTAEKANQVEIFLACIRLKDVRSDVLITYNAPTAINEQSQCKGSVVLSSEENTATARLLLSTFRINNWGLFV